MADFPSDKYSLDCKYVSFCIELNTFKRLGIANSFLFIIFQCCYFYVMSQSIFPDQIRPRPLIHVSCLNCAAHAHYQEEIITKFEKILPLDHLVNFNKPGTKYPWVNETQGFTNKDHSAVKKEIELFLS